MPSNLVRHLAPAVSGRGPSTVSNGGKPQAATPGTFLDLPDNSSDAQLYQASGWQRLGYVGTTANRLVNPAANTLYIDTTLSKMIVYDGAVWRDPSSGSSV